MGAAVAAEFDQDWGKQGHPDPRIRPQSIAAKSRLEDHYTQRASEGRMQLDEYKIKLFPVMGTAVRIDARAKGPAASEPTTTPALSTSGLTALASSSPTAAPTHAEQKPQVQEVASKVVSLATSASVPNGETSLP